MELRDDMIDHIQKVLIRLRNFRGELYAAITDDDETLTRVRDDLEIMIERLRAADDEQFLRAEEAVDNAERRRLEAFGV